MSASPQIDQPKHTGAIVAGGPEAGELDSPSFQGIRTVLLFERDDDVFRRLASDLVAVGFRVIRAKTSTEAIGRYVRNPASLLIVNADQPGESAWLLSAKLHLTHPAAHVWVYARRLSTFDVAAANFLVIDELIEYQGDLSRLTDEVLKRLSESAAQQIVPAENRSRAASAQAVA